MSEETVDESTRLAHERLSAAAAVGGFTTGGVSHWRASEANCAAAMAERAIYLATDNARLRAALEKERQRYMSLADRQAKRGKDETAQEFWDKAEAIAEVLKS